MERLGLGLSRSEARDCGPVADDDDTLRPAVIETDSPLYKGYKSLMVYARVKKRAFPDEVFTLDFLPRIETIR